jgi:hypothetical protein
LDDVHYREYKILLKPERLFSPERLEEYWDTVSKIAKHHGVGVTTNPNAFFRLVREVLFYDTPTYDLYRNSFILRSRTFYDNGWPRPDHELAIKFRHADLQTAANVDVRPSVPTDYRIKFKEELLPQKISLGGIRSLYSHNCILTSPLVVLEQGIRDITDFFPALQQLPAHADSRISLVNSVAVEEVQVDVGSFHFGHDLDAKATIAIWRNRATEKSLVGEFAFQAKFKRQDRVHHKALELSETFYKSVQTRAPEWVELGTTKTAMVYGITHADHPVHDE